VRRIRLRFAGGWVVFADRGAALGRVVEWGVRGTYLVHVVYGPEGCGKTAWLRQAAALLRDMGYEVLYIDAVHRYFEAYTDARDVVRRLAADALGRAEIRLATLAIDLARELIKRRRVKKWLKYFDFL